MAPVASSSGPSCGTRPTRTGSPTPRISASWTPRAGCPGVRVPSDGGQEARGGRVAASGRCAGVGGVCAHRITEVWARDRRGNAAGGFIKPTLAGLVNSRELGRLAAALVHHCGEAAAELIASGNVLRLLRGYWRGGARASSRRRPTLHRAPPHRHRLTDGIPAVREGQPPPVYGRVTSSSGKTNDAYGRPVICSRASSQVRLLHRHASRSRPSRSATASRKAETGSSG